MCIATTFVYDCGHKHLVRLHCSRKNPLLCDDVDNRAARRYYDCCCCIEYQLSLSADTRKEEKKDVEMDMRWGGGKGKGPIGEWGEDEVMESIERDDEDDKGEAAGDGIGRRARRGAKGEAEYMVERYNQKGVADRKGKGKEGVKEWLDKMDIDDDDENEDDEEDDDLPPRKINESQVGYDDVFAPESDKPPPSPRPGFSFKFSATNEDPEMNSTTALRFKAKTKLKLDDATTVDEDQDVDDQKSGITS